MIERLIIRGGIPLRGSVTVSGGKNAALAVLPATLLGNSPSTIENLPDVSDVHVAMDMLRCLGADVSFDGKTMRINPAGVSKYTLPYELASRMRASYYFVPVLLGLFGKAEVPMPGGCNIGARPIDQTLKGLSTLGAHVETLHGALVASCGALQGTEVFLDCPSVGATVNTLLMAVVSPGNTFIYNAAKEPHVVDLANFLSSMGAWVKGAGTDVIRVRGNRPLHGSTYAIIPDQIETGTLMIAAAATGGDVVISGAIPTHMEALSAKLLEAGVSIHDEDDLIHVRALARPLRGISVKTQVYPGFPTDLQQPLTAMLSIAGGQSIISETLFESRFRYVEELRRMGANIRLLEQRTAIVDGVESLTGAKIMAHDLRAGAALVVAGLMARGETSISGVKYIMRGYERLDEKLRSIGAQIEYRQEEGEE